jgi:hypothetical protein
MKKFFLIWNTTLIIFKLICKFDNFALNIENTKYSKFFILFILAIQTDSDLEIQMCRDRKKIVSR